MTTLREAAQQALEQPEQAEQEPVGDSYADLFNALQRIETAAVFLPSFKITHEGGLEAVVQNIVDAIAALEQPEPPPEAQTEAEKIAYCAGWWAAMEQKREQPEQGPVTNNPDPYHLSRILHELAGSASMCWEHVDRAGVFQSTQAADVVAAAIAEIRQRMKDAPPRREWRGLSEEEIDRWTPEIHPVILAIEAALRRKNHE
jgi:hypothetical protein